VKPGDTTYVMGDVSLLKPERVAEFVQRMNGSKVLIPGNHDYCHPMHEKWREYAQRYIEAGFDAVLYGSDMSIRIDNDFPVVLSHFPYDGDHTPKDRHVEWRPVDLGVPLVCGHVHEVWRTHLSATGTKMLNVGVDVNDFYPVSEHAVLEALQ
jgi:calcineurin-like phosphoesterase family protein